MSKSVLGFYLWGHSNVESADYILGRMREHYPDSHLVISSDAGEDFSEVARKHSAVGYIHGKESHGYPQKDERYGWTATEAKLWLERIYEACQIISNEYVMLMEEDILIKERFRFQALDLVMIPNIRNAIAPCAMEWVKSRGGVTHYPYYSAGGGTIINRKKFIGAYEKHIDSLLENYNRLYEQSFTEGVRGWGWNDSLLCVLMYAEGATFSASLPIIESGNEDDPAPIIHNFKKYYKKNLKMQRYDIINKIAEKISAESYLEIGVYNPADCFDKIRIKHKESVDPGIDGLSLATHKLTSDDFFASLEAERRWDIIFIDGLHTGEQVYLDVKNALKHLNENGYIVLHDCNPPTIYHARELQSDRNQPAGASWNGTVWKAFQKLRTTHSNLLDMVTVDTDWGVGVLRKGKSVAISEDFNSMYDYVYFDKNRKDVLLLVNEEEFLNWL